MVTTRHEEYKYNNLPFILNADLERTYYKRSAESNWHENLEIQFCTKGSGTVLLDGEKYDFQKDDIIVVNSNIIHYTGTDTKLTYSCIIVSNDFCQQMGIDPRKLTFSPRVKNQNIVDQFCALKKIYMNPDIPFRTAKLNEIVLKILIELADNHITKTKSNSNIKNFETVKSVITYIRKNYNKKITLDEISKVVLCDKYALCREFKRLTGQTIIENLNNYRCINAMGFLNEGYTVAKTAELCGFDNLSFFTKTFKKYIGKLPSEYKK